MLFWHRNFIIVIVLIIKQDFYFSRIFVMENENKKTFSIVSGGFDPVHEGHVALFKAAAKLGDGIIILLNSDDWLCRKKGKNFQSFFTRKTVCENFKDVIEVLSFNDSDNTASDGIEKVRVKYPDARLIFANGGDRGKDNVPEAEACRKNNVEMVFGVGGESKANSSSWILNDWSRK